MAQLFLKRFEYLFVLAHRDIRQRWKFGASALGHGNYLAEFSNDRKGSIRLRSGLAGVAETGHPPWRSDWLPCRVATRLWGSAMLRLARFALTLAALSVAACASSAAAELPGSATFPLVAGSAIEPCPADWLSGTAGEAVCVSAPNDDTGHAIVEAYQRALAERGFRFGRYLDSPSLVMLTRHTGNDCDVMIFGLPYLPPEQRTRLVLIFGPDQASPEDCARIEREGQR